MKRGLIKILAMSGLGLLTITGCATHHPVKVTPAGEIVVAEAPPAPRQETIGTAPSANHVWVPGYWAWNNKQYVWIPGHWELRPRTTANWVPGHWDHTSRGWVWTPGRWD